MTKEWLPSFDPQDEPFYQTIVEALEADIDSGRLAPGYRLPTQRRLAQRRTARADPWRGPSRHFRGYARDRPLDLGVNGSRRRYRFGGQLSDLLLRSDLGPVLSRLAVDSSRGHLLRYPPPGGFPEHRETGAEWLKRFGAEVEADNVLVTAGAQHAIMVAIATVTRPGDTILSEASTFPGIKAVADTLDLRLLGVPMDRGGLLPDELEAFCKRYSPRALYCNPTLNNPTQTTLDGERRRAVVEIARRYDLLLVEDEVHRTLARDPPPLLAKLASERTFLLTSFSKAVVAGLRVGFLAVPPVWRERTAATLQATLIGVSPLNAEVFRCWLEDGTVDRTVRRRRREARVRHRLAAELLDNYPVEASGEGHLLWLPLPESWASAELALELRRRGVTVASAETFAVPPSLPARAIRLCLGSAEQSVLRRGLGIVAEVLAAPPSCGLATL
nr:uncharacterized HTH-type transcriptional regulator RHOS4_30730-like [Nerophis lumbriciformis]